jgi:hypothetical protein
MTPWLHTTIRLLGLLMLVLPSTPSAVTQQEPIASLRSSNIEPNVLVVSDTGTPPLMTRTPAGILAAFLKTETQVREALNQHTFKRDVVLQTIGRDGQITGEYIRNSQFLFDDKGNRIERVLYHPPSTIREMRITREDIQDLAGAQLLGIDIVESTKYRLNYTGDEMLEGRPVYVVSVEPTAKPDPHHMSERFFCGRVWIDAQTFQVVKIKGVVEPHGKQRFPVFETWREPISAALYLPARTEADDTLHFQQRDVRYRIRVRYFDYKIFASKLKVTEVDEPTN